MPADRGRVEMEIVREHLRRPNANGAHLAQAIWIRFKPGYKNVFSIASKIRLEPGRIAQITQMVVQVRPEAKRADVTQDEPPGWFIHRIEWQDSR